MRLATLRVLMATAAVFCAGALASAVTPNVGVLPAFRVIRGSWRRNPALRQVGRVQAANGRRNA